MIRSMTAFARSEAEVEGGSGAVQLIWELRAVNHRYREIQTRLPDEFRALEPELRQRFAACVARGKVEAMLTVREQGEGGAFEVDWPRAEALIRVCAELLARGGDAVRPASVAELLRHPGMLREPQRGDTALQEGALELLDQALAQLLDARAREGAQLTEVIGQRVEAAQEAVRLLAGRREAINRLVRERLQARLASLPQPADPGRLEQELVYVAQRSDIDEELDRLTTHLAEVQRLLTAAEPVGRRLDFLMQELNREANTIASKAADTATSNTAVELKVWIEQMREQVQNVE
ncbi:YicC family protein [Halorhodospira abdelmalekii]|uniref:YicC/YloC family endoribonuclease n=1 Tax=Halorhodospira abdelmalekii TaxID=421629 RepID=UPI0019030CC2|nr:YicC/YloC family endoribonuclease [Halorhodospira abdelmalekii]MBK1735802.1 YicC family protein [Halorhodospira abdelmalekii]